MQEETNNNKPVEGEKTYNKPEGERSYNRPEGERTYSRPEGERSFNKKPRFSFKRKKCRFCGKDKASLDKDISYKNIEILQKFVSDRGKILPSRLTGNCAIHQRKLKVEIKKARYMALLPFAKIEKLNK